MVQNKTKENPFGKLLFIIFCTPHRFTNIGGGEIVLILIVKPDKNIGKRRLNRFFLAKSNNPDVEPFYGSFN